MQRARFFVFACAALCLIVARAQAAFTVQFVEVPITPAAVTSDPTLANMQTWSIQVDYSEGNWASGGLRMQLPAGNAFYHQTPFGGNTKPSPALVAAFPSVAYDTYVTSPRDLGGGTNAPAILGPFPENQPPQSFGGASDPLPGVFSVSWGDPQATQGPTSGNDVEIARLTFPRSNPLGSLAASTMGQTSTVNPSVTIPIVIPEPGMLGLAAAAGLLAIRRRK